MLNFLRKKNVMKKVLWAMVLLIVPAFVLWGAGSALREKSGKPSHVGTINGKKVSFEDFNDSISATWNQLVLQFYDRPEMLREMADKLDLKVLAWNRLIMLDAAEERNIEVSDRELSVFVRNHPLFVRGGIFDAKGYQRIIRSNLKMSPRKFEEQIRNSLKIEKLKDELTSGIVATGEEAWEAYKTENEAVRLVFAIAEPEDYTDKIEYKPENLKIFYEDNAGSFRRPPQYNIEYARIDTLDDTVLQNIYDDARSGEGLEKISAKHGFETNESGFFYADSEIPGIGLSYEIIKALNGLIPGQTGDLIRIQSGEYYLVKLKDKRESFVPPFESVKDDVIRLFKEQKAVKKAKAAAEDMGRALKDSPEEMNFEQAAAQYGLEVTKTGEAIKRSDYIPGIGQSENFIKTAFALEPNGVSDTVETEKGFCVIKLAKLIPADREGFAEEKEEYKKKVTRQKKLSALNEWFEERSRGARLALELGR
jgi:hypothetical protein